MMIFQSDVDIEKSEETLIPKVEEIHQKLENQFCKVILYAILYDKNNLKEIILDRISKK